MSTRTARWVSRTSPGMPPPPPSRSMSVPPPPPPTVYPESSVSNPNASRYTGRPSRPPSSAARSGHSRSRSASLAYGGSGAYGGGGGGGSMHSYHSSSRGGGGGSSHPSSYRPGSTPPMQTFYAGTEQPIIARTSSASGRTSSYMIIPAAGQHVEILHPNPARSRTVSYTTTTSTSHKEKPLIKRLFDKVEWGSGSSAGRSSASRGSSTRVLRRNSTGGSSTVVTSSGTRVTSTSGRVYEVHYT